ncbi:DNA repair protein RecN [Rhodovulum sp. DZ06]|uniref:DNA repair protein RecN n=1 Tax=Rhodovulum sp. DZ06 TaxID=3425126 RepID=UPI003D349F58
MLRSLSIQDIVLIDRLDLEFGPGLTVLTGETGAGKSILLGALGFAIGRRGRGASARAGTEKGVVEAVFDCPEGHAVRAALAELGMDAGEELILRRQVTAEGRTAAWVNDRRATADALARLGDALLEVHGQHDDRGLLNPRGHRGILDGWAGHGALLADARAKWDALRRAEGALDDARRALAAAAEDAEFLRHAVEELDALAPQPGEDEALDSERRLMQAAERIGQDVGRAQQALGRDGAEGMTADAMRWLEDASQSADGALDGPIAALERALHELADAQAGVETALENLAFDPARLEMVTERLFALRGLARKHRVGPEALPELAEDMRRRLAEIDGGEEHIAGLEAAAAAARAAYDGAAAALTAARKDAAAKLEAAVGAELPPLKMERAIFAVDVAPEAPGPDGVDRVAFTVAPNPGAPAGPLGAIASGGELSRFLLALKASLAGRGEEKTMIFDEIDRGVGGATADAVGRRLEALSHGGQVLVVTHAPQVAARGAAHLHIEKRVEGDETRTIVRPIGEAEREGELARMLAGETVTEAAREAARALLAD